MLLDEITEMTSPSLLVHENIIDSIATEQLVEIINQLPIGYKTIFNLFAIEGFSHQEIAEQLDISVSTSKSQFFYAKKALQKRLTDLKFERHG